jgi:hypothetical protein
VDINEIPTRSSEGNVNVFVEIPKDSQNKYEYDEDLGMILLTAPSTRRCATRRITASCLGRVAQTASRSTRW